MSSPDFAPIITRDLDGWLVSVARNGRVHVYKCENERDAKRFQELLAKPLLDPPSRRYLPTRQERRPGVSHRIHVMTPPRWANVHL